MSVTQVGICNLALIKVGGKRISSIDENTKPAILLKAIYDQKRDTMFRAHRWNCATKRVTLSPTATTPDWGYDYEYDLPNDYLGIADPENEDIEFVIEGSKLRTDEPEFNLTYIFKNTDEATWDTSFQEAFAAELASDICYALTQSATLTDMRRKEAKEKLEEAKSNDAIEGTAKRLQIDSWTRVRR
jgi:hypothetical protein